jgi:DNA-binding beta-propeller fold protein YncE
MRKLLSSLDSLIEWQTTCALFVSAAWFCGAAAVSRGADLLVVDRLSHSVYRYSETGALLGTVIASSNDLNQPTGIGMSPDFLELYVSSSQNNHVMKYDYNAATGVASNPSVFADAGDGLAFPNDIQFSPDGSKVYVANLDGGVSRFNADGSSAGAKLTLSPTAGNENFAASSMSFTPAGELLVGAFEEGGVVISDSSVSTFPEYLVEPTPAIIGATGLMVHDGYVYVSGLFTSSIRRFELSSGQIDAAWAITGVGFPQDLVEAPDGNGFLAGILGFAAGGGSITRYAFDGTLLSTFAVPSEDGFTEATAFVVVPTPLLGDYNGDGTVDAGDYTVWRDNFGSTTWLPNDDTPGVVDGSDYDDWRASFGTSAPAGSAALEAAAVPESASLLLLSAMLAGGLARKRN